MNKENISRIFSLLIIFVIVVLFQFVFSAENKIDCEDLAKKVNGWGLGSDPDIYFDKEIELGHLINYLNKNGLYSPSIDNQKYYPKNIKIYKAAISSSSYLKNDARYSPQNLYDNNIKTTWAEGAQTYGFKEWIKIKYRAKLIDKNDKTRGNLGPDYVIINPGYGASNKLFKENNRLKTVVLLAVSKYIINGKNKIVAEVFRLHFPDKNKYFSFHIESPELIASDLEYTFFIESVYRGSKYNDTCISEIIFATY